MVNLRSSGLFSSVLQLTGFISRDLLYVRAVLRLFVLLDQTFNFVGGQFLVLSLLSNISQLFLDFVAGGVILVVTFGKILKELCFLSGSFFLEGGL